MIGMENTLEISIRIEHRESQDIDWTFNPRENPAVEALNFLKWVSNGCIEVVDHKAVIDLQKIHSLRVQHPR
jgi:hypothetical protein